MFVTIQNFSSCPFVFHRQHHAGAGAAVGTVQHPVGGGPGRVMCMSCDWTGTANSTRMRLHALENHPDIPPSTSPSKEPTASTATPAASDSTHAAVVASQAVLKQQRRHVYHLQKKRQRSLTDFCDRRITGDEQSASKKAQWLMVVMAGLSYNSQDHPATSALAEDEFSLLKGNSFAHK